MVNKISRSALVMYSAEEMFRLVRDVESYDRFLPWCSFSRVLSQDEDLQRASIEISHRSLRKSFTTCNRLQQNKMIEVRLEQGPFKRLEGFWRFDMLDAQACKVSLDLNFEFSNKLVDLALRQVFSQISSSMVDAFSERAVEIYGKR